uniref:BED-type domain-containing protein n=1 Tax=Cyprinus carpio TaxID=7962 RepID=A0A8C1QG11_CYPCA
NMKCRKYQDSYLKYFILILFSRSKESLPQPQCIICAKVLVNECMRLSKLIRHLQTTHPQYHDKPKAIAEKIAKAKKAHTIAETLILPCETKIVKELCGDKSKQLAKIPLSNNTIKRRIAKMSEKVTGQLYAQLRENKIKEDFLFCKELSYQRGCFPCRYNALLSAQIGACDKRNGSQSSWSFRCGRKNRELCESKSHQLLVIHCSLQRGRRCYHTLLMHTDVRWLSRGRVLMCLFSLREELSDFLADKRPHLADYLLDIFGEMNKLNRAMQGVNINTVVQRERVEAFKRKLHMWKTCVSSRISDMFEHTYAFIADRHLNFKIIQRQITVHLLKVLDKFDSYFSALTEKQAADILCITNPFTENIEAKLQDTLQPRLLEELIEISPDASLKAHFSEVPLESFCSEIAEEHPVCHTAAMKVLIPFSTTYLCEAGLSTMTALKTKYRARLTLVDDMCLALSKISPCIDQIITHCQQQSSH